MWQKAPWGPAADAGCMAVTPGHAIEVKATDSTSMIRRVMILAPSVLLSLCEYPRHG
jgi:hypothetical protein